MVWLVVIFTVVVVAAMTVMFIPIRPTAAEVVKEAYQESLRKIDVVVGRTCSLMYESAMAYKPFSFYELYLEHQKHCTCKEEER